jgi:hypothetical protein
MPRLTTNLDQGFQIGRQIRGSEITRLDTGRYSTAFLFAMSLSACVLASVVLIYALGH